VAGDAALAPPDEHAISTRRSRRWSTEGRGLAGHCLSTLHKQRDHLVALAARYAIPAIFQFREFAAAGGLFSYGACVVEGYLPTPDEA